VELDASEIQTFYSDQGYVLAAVRPRTTINSEEKEVSVTYRVSERDLMYVSKIDIKGNVKTKDSVIRRKVTILPGERYDGGKIRRSRQKLLNTQFYKDVYINTEATNRQNYRDLILEVEEDKTGSFNFGAGFSSNDAFIGQIQILQSNFDLFNPPSFTGAGQKFNLTLRPGTVLSEYQLGITEPYFMGYPFAAGITEPYFMGYPFAAGFNVYFVDREYDEYDQESFGGQLSFGKDITDFSSVGLSYNISDFEISNVDEDAPQSIKDEEGSRTKSSISLSFTNDTRDSYIDPTTPATVTSIPPRGINTPPRWSWRAGRWGPRRTLSS